ncbi:protein ACCELERATED CELL DEATH 6-like [Henckelia pumila]|uniref:protein ACCELERATED CELL DEATH 6-like n=1 Tax=Henckelia pumila TaxID=405737 RepID=UPI003C6DE6EF
MGKLDLSMELQRRNRSIISRPENNNQATTESGNNDQALTADTFKNYGLYLAAKHGDLNHFSSILHYISSSGLMSCTEILSRVSPVGNTFLHVAAQHGNKDMVNYIATKAPSIVLRKDFNGDTALHLAAKAGDESMVKALVSIHHDLLRLGVSHEFQVGSSDDENNLLRAKNERGNTAFHESLINGWESIAQYLIKQDPELLYYPNKRGKYGLNLAAKAGFVNCVSSILECSIDHDERLNDQFKEKSPIKTAIMNKKRDVLEVILNSTPRFIELQDSQGRTPLHYAASSGYIEVVHYLVTKHAFGVIQRDKSGSSPVHLAAIEGHVDTISLLLKSCPVDPSELLDKSGRNMLHLAAKNGKFNVVSYILRHPELAKLINTSDKQGNTALHLATMNWHPEIVSALTWDKRVDIKLRNDKRMTALDAAEYYYELNNIPPFRQRLTWAALKAAGTPRGKGKIKKVSSNYSVEKYKERVNTLLLVSTLVATITFAAGFTLPGGYNPSDHTDPGMAALLRQKAFHVFVFCDTIAMYSSILVAVALIWAQLGDLKLVLDAMSIVQPLLVVALTMMSVAFTAGIFVAVRDLRWLSMVVLAMGSAFLLLLLVLLVPFCMPLASSNKILRYISYWPFWLLMFATRTK